MDEAARHETSTPGGARPWAGLRLGLCCTFLEEPIRFRMTTARYVSTLPPDTRRTFLLEISGHNVGALAEAISWCHRHGIGAFRVTSRLLPLYTHPALGWSLDAWDGDGRLRAALEARGREARELGVRLSFHPDQFVVLGSTNEASIALALRELEYQAECAALLSAGQLTLHGGGAQGGKEAALERLRRGLDRLSPRARGLLALENDDKIFTPADLFPLCREEGLPLVYDVHHHRCNPDDLSIEEATELSRSSWGEREPWLHVSSPAGGWGARQTRSHADDVDPCDLPPAWRGLRATVDVEAKRKEQAVLRLLAWLRKGEACELPAGPDHTIQGEGARADNP